MTCSAAPCACASVRAICACSSGAQAVGRQRAARVARMHAGLLDVLHDAADVARPRRRRSRRRRPRSRGRGTGRAAPGLSFETLTASFMYSAQVVLAEDDFHGASAQHVATVARPADSPPRPAMRDRRPSVRAVQFGGCLRFSRSTSCWKRSRSSATSIESGVVPMIGTPAGLPSARAA